jgi:hypothetical protein
LHAVTTFVDFFEREFAEACGNSGASNSGARNLSWSGYVVSDQGVCCMFRGV